MLRIGVIPIIGSDFFSCASGNFYISSMSDLSKVRINGGCSVMVARVVVVRKVWVQLPASTLERRGR